MNRLTLTLLVSILVLSTAFQIKNISHDIPIQNAPQYAQYIQALNGLATEFDLQNNPKLNQLIQESRASLLNPESDIVLALIDEIKLNNENLPTVQDLTILNQLDTMISAFNMVDLADLDPQTLIQKVEELQKIGKTVHTLEVSLQLLQKLQTFNSRRLQQTSQGESSSEDESSVSVKQHHEETLYKQQTAKAVKKEKTNPTYILKFFFGFIFIIVSLGSLMAISNMQNRKDTLLYAKFIADVGAR